MKLTKEQKDQIILQALLQVKAGNHCEEDGICSAVEERLYRHCKTIYPDWGYWEIVDSDTYRKLEARWARLRKKAFKSWKHFSGDADFPVPAGGSTQNEKKVLAKNAFRGSFNMWEGSYGKRRKALLNHTIRYLKEEIKNAKS